jgi:hypothetical protein
MIVTVSSAFDSETALGITVDSNSITEVPLVVTGLTKTAFLAHIKFEWVNREGENEHSRMNPPTEIDHWVNVGIEYSVLIDY